MRGALIVVEGLDGVGKSTFSHGLARRLGAEWRTTSTPPGVPSPISPTARQLFYASAVAEASLKLASLTRAGTTVVLDRYWASTCAYAHATGRAVDLRDVEERLLSADVTFFLTAPLEVRRSRIATRSVVTAADAETLSREREAALLAAYQHVLGRRVSGQVVVLDTSRASPAALVSRASVAVKGVRKRLDSHPVHAA